MTITYIDYGNIWVCTDCYFAHHYGYRAVAEFDPPEHEGWYAGESDTPCDREPLSEIPDDLEVTDNTCADHTVEVVYDEDGDSTSDTTACEHCGQTGHEDGLDDFSWRRCDGCGSTLGGSRSRLHLSKRETT